MQWTELWVKGGTFGLVWLSLVCFEFCTSGSGSHFMWSLCSRIKLIDHMITTAKFTSHNTVQYFTYQQWFGNRYLITLSAKAVRSFQRIWFDLHGVLVKFISQMKKIWANSSFASTSWVLAWLGFLRIWLNRVVIIFFWF